jgi:hypothetical protein
MEQEPRDGKVTVRQIYGGGGWLWFIYIQLNYTVYQTLETELSLVSRLSGSHYIAFFLRSQF